MAFDLDALLELETRIRELREEAGEHDSDGETRVAPGQAENSTIKAIRAEAKREAKRAAEAEAKLAELEAFKDEVVARTRAEALSRAGFTEAQAAVFTKAYDDVSDANIQAFRREVLGLGDEAEEEGTVLSGPVAPAGFASERLAKPIEGRDAVREYVRKHGPEAAAKAWEEGKLKV